MDRAAEGPCLGFCNRTWSMRALRLFADVEGASQEDLWEIRKRTVKKWLKIHNVIVITFSTELPGPKHSCTETQHCM